MSQHSGESCSERTVVVGVKMDSKSRELLTWALVKVAQTGDRLIALHVLADHEIVDQDGKSSLLTLVKPFDSVLAVYEGFCNLKQVHLKLKMCRGSSVRKILVGTEIILGTAQNHHSLGSSVSIAKHCAKKPSRNCSVLAVSNVKIAFQKDTCSKSNLGAAKGVEENHRNRILSALQSSSSKEYNILPDANLANRMLNGEHGIFANSGQTLLKWGYGFKERFRSCSICSPECHSVGNTCAPPMDDSSANSDESNSMAIVTVEKLEGSSKSQSLLMNESPQLKPGWPLLCRAISTHWETGRSLLPSVSQISVVHWAMRLPSTIQVVLQALILVKDKAILIAMKVNSPN